MKTFKKLFAFTFLFAFMCGSTTVFAASKDVNTFAEFESALMDSRITEINVLKSITFTKNISKGIPNRDIVINGNADKGVQINSDRWSIYGKQNKRGKNTFSIVNADIKGRGTPGSDSYTDGRFFTGGEENGPRAYGWDVYAKDVKYTGARFVHLSNGTLTFDGSNEIYTNCENAWVEHVVFKAGSTYKSSNSGTGDYAAFYFNKGNCIADGTATIEAGAKTYFNVGTAVQPVFTGDVYKILVERDALFDVNCLGYAVRFLAGNRRYYQMGQPEFTVYGNVNINESDNILNAKLGKKNTNKTYYIPILFQKCGEPQLGGSLNIKQGSTFYLTGETKSKSNEGLIRGGNGFVINIDNPRDFDIRNNAINSVVISALVCHRITINLNSNIKSWWKTNNGSYDNNNPYRSYTGIVGTIYMRNHYTDRNNTNNWDFNKNFWMHDYGRIALSGNGGIVKTYDVTFNSNGGTPVLDQAVDENELVIKPADPIRVDYDFIGWFKDAALTTPWDFDNDRVNSNITLYATWKPQEVFYEVTFDSNGGTPVISQTIKENGLVQKPTDPTSGADGFLGWYKDSALTTVWDFDNDRVTSAITLYASWSKNVPQFTVTFESNGGTDVKEQLIYENDPVIKPADPINGSLVFDGWYKDSLLTTPWNFTTDKVGSDITLYAAWKRGTAPGIYYYIEYRSSRGDYYARVLQNPVPLGTIITLDSKALNLYWPHPQTHKEGIQKSGSEPVFFNGQTVLVIYQAK